MKIFSWVHRQFLHKVANKDDNDKATLLENDGWKGAGILAIGTFGVDLCQDFKAKECAFMSNQAFFFDNNDDDDDGDNEMECHPLVRKASKHGFDDHVDHKQNLSPCDEVAKTNNRQEDVVIVKDSMKVRKRGERTTLVDLLRADSGNNNLFDNYKLSNDDDDHKIKARYHNNDNDNNNNNNNSKSKIDTGSIKSFLVSKAKKKLGRDDSARPMKRTKQLMKKMLRKKIHPDVGIQKMEIPSMVSQEMDYEHAT